MIEESITEADLDAAIEAKRQGINPNGHTSICLLAQFAKRVTGKNVIGSTTHGLVSFDWDRSNPNWGQPINGIRTVAQQARKLRSQAHRMARKQWEESERQKKQTGAMA